MYSSPLLRSNIATFRAPCPTTIGSGLILSRPEVSIDMNTLTTCTRTLPNTCFDASKNQILTGRWGRSLHLLYTRARRARPPRASCTSRANGPRSRHSMLPGSGAEPGCDEVVAAITAPVAVVVTMIASTVCVGSSAGTWPTPMVGR